MRFYLYSFTTVFIALLLELIPLPGWSVWLKPEWVLLVTIYWLMATPEQFRLISAFSIGTLLDLSNGTLLGEHALAFIVIAYFVLKFYQPIRIRPISAQLIFIFGLIASYKIIIFIIQALIDQSPHSVLYWLSIFSSTLLWPWVFILLRDVRRRI